MALRAECVTLLFGSGAAHLEASGCAALHYAALRCAVIHCVAVVLACRHGLHVPLWNMMPASAM